MSSVIAADQPRYTSAAQFSTLLSGLSAMILAERKARGLSVRAAAEECGIPWNCLSRAERNIGLPSTPVFMAIVAWLGVPGWNAFAAALKAASKADKAAPLVRVGGIDAAELLAWRAER